MDVFVEDGEDGHVDGGVVHADGRPLLLETL